MLCVTKFQILPDFVFHFFKLFFYSRLYTEASAYSSELPPVRVTASLQGEEALEMTNLDSRERGAEFLAPEV